MEINQYVDLAMVTKNSDLINSELLSNSVMGLSGETGEVADLVKKHLFQGHDLNKASVVEEVGDILWYIALLCDTLDLDLEMVMCENINKLKSRYPDGFDEYHSKNRK